MNDTDLKAYFSSELLSWYKSAKRDLPWRRSRDPYSIWVSEIMLQQTRVDTVIPYYHRFMERFPTLADLAGAPEEDVLKAWEGLGYYSRARNLQAGAQEVTRLHGGRVPDDKVAVAALKGVGPYTSGAIMSIAFGRPEPAVDGNVMRVLSRYFAIDDDIAKPKTRIRMEGLAKELIPEGEAADFNQGLMELGALICTPKSPGCLVCPVMMHCQGRLAGRERELPIKSKAKPPKAQYRLAALVTDAAGRVLVRQRPSEGLLARLWELPHIEAASLEDWASPSDGPAALKEALRADNLQILPVQHIGDAEHIFSHLHWYLRVWSARPARQGSLPHANLVPLAAEASAPYAADPLNASIAAGEASASPSEDATPLPDSYRWIGLEEFEQLAWPNVFRKILGDYFSDRSADEE